MTPELEQSGQLDAILRFGCVPLTATRFGETT
jgi:hypothetical protein